MTPKPIFRLYFNISPAKRQQLTNGYTSNWYKTCYCKITNQNVLYLCIGETYFPSREHIEMHIKSEHGILETPKIFNEVRNMLNNNKKFGQNIYEGNV